MGVNITLDAGALAALDKAVLRAAELTIEALKTDVIASQVMPYNDGTMQNTDTFTDVSSSGDTVTAALVTGSPQARRLFFHPEYNFSRERNKAAGGEWFEPYLNGAKKDFAQSMFEKFLSSGMKRLGG